MILLHYHSYSIPPSAIIEVSSSVVSFGSLVCEHQISSRGFTVKNTGTKEGGFTIHTSSLPFYFTVSPKEGKLQPNQSVDIMVSKYLYVDPNATTISQDT